MTVEPPGSGQSRTRSEANGSMDGAMSRMILTVMAAMAQLDCEIMLERQRDGIAFGGGAGDAAPRHPRHLRTPGLPHPRRASPYTRLNTRSINGRSYRVSGW